MGRTWRALVFEDNAVLRRVIVRLMSSIPGVEVVGQANSGQSALEAVDRLVPDLVLMDLAMPGMDGLEATRRLAVRSDAPSVIIISIHDLPPYREAARSAGARRFVAKADLVGQLGPAIEGLTTDHDAGCAESIYV